MKNIIERLTGKEVETRLYVPTQLVMALHPIALKVLIYILSWQTQKEIRLYPRYTCKSLGMTKEELDIAIQTLINLELMEIEKDNERGYWEISFYIETFNEFANIDFKTMVESDKAPLATEVIWREYEDVEALSHEKKAELYAKKYEIEESYKSNLSLEIRNILIRAWNNAMINAEKRFELEHDESNYKKEVVIQHKSITEIPTSVLKKEIERRKAYEKE